MHLRVLIVVESELIDILVRGVELLERSLMLEDFLPDEHRHIVSRSHEMIHFG